ncbi:MAG: hypothetical protein V1744_07765 [Candidatus Altiarchaeota archaeon]
MGFFDRLFTGKKSLENIKLSGLGLWIDERIKYETQGIVKESKDALMAVGELVQKIRSDVTLLDGRGYNDIEPRYDKILRTAKPSYAKSMLKALEGLDFKGSAFDEIQAYRARLAAALDTIGKVNFGDGKFLMIAFQDDMIKIQGNCKRLLAEKERLDGISSSNKSLQEITELKKEYGRYLGVIASQEKLRVDSLSLKRAIDASKKSLSLAASELDRLKNGSDAVKVGKLNSEIESVESDIREIESTIHSLLSPLKPALRKYQRPSAEAAGLIRRKLPSRVESMRLPPEGDSFRAYEKTVLDNTHSKIVKSLQDNPAEAFLTSTESDFEAIFSGLANACKSESIALKDSGKTIKKIEAASSILTDDVRKRHASLTSKLKNVQAEMSMIPLREAEGKISNDIHQLEHSLKNDMEYLKDVEAKLMDSAAESGREVEELKTKLLGLGFALSE